jgi:hypothetical protein
MRKSDFIEICNLHLISPAIALENKQIVQALKDIKNKKINLIKGQLLISTILENQF